MRPTHGAGTWRPCGTRTCRSGGRPATAGWSARMTPPPPPACLHLRPLPPGRWQAPHRVGGLVGPGVGQPPRPPAPYPPWARGEVVRRGETWPTRFMPSYPRWAALPERGRSTPRPGGPTSSAIMTRGRTGTSCTRSSRKLSASLGNGRKAAPRARGRPPCPLLVAGGHLPLRRPLHHPARPPWGGDRTRPPDHSATGLRYEINLHACLAAPLAPPLGPSNHWRLPPLLGQRELHIPPPPRRCWVFPP